jgi:IS5 family transposase
MANVSLFDFEPTKQTSRGRFFEEIEPFLPMEAWKAMIAPIYHAPTKLGGRPPKDLEVVLRSFLVQNFFTLSDEGTEDTIRDSLSVRRFVGISINDDDIPDKSTICRFRNLLVEHDIQQKIFETIVATLESKGLIMKKGTIVDSTIIENSTSKRNALRSRDPESAWTKKAGRYFHGFKGHIGVDADSGLVTSNITTAANISDVNIGNANLHGEEEAIYGDSGYLNMENHRNALAARKYLIMRRRSSLAKLPEEQQGEAKKREQGIASIRSKVEHVFATVKRLFGFGRTLYKGLKKNAAKLNMMFALANIWKISRRRTA